MVKRAGLASEDVCQQIVDDGDSLGTDGVGSNDKFEVEFTVHQDEFDAGEVNYICAADNESPSNRLASAVKVFDVTPSLTISPDSVSSGEEVTLKPRDFEDATAEEPLDGVVERRQILDDLYRLPTGRTTCSTCPAVCPAWCRFPSSRVATPSAERSRWTHPA